VAATRAGDVVLTATILENQFQTNNNSFYVTGSTNALNSSSVLIGRNGSSTAATLLYINSNSNLYTGSTSNTGPSATLANSTTYGESYSSSNNYLNVNGGATSSFSNSITFPAATTIGSQTGGGGSTVWGGYITKLVTYNAVKTRL
jgi:hypothetical protein